MEYKKVSEEKFKRFINSKSLDKFTEVERADKLDLVTYRNSSEEIIAKYYIDPNTNESFGFSIRSDQIKRKKNDTRKIKKASK